MEEEIKNIAIIGVGGRTGTMFAFELSQHYGSVFGIGRKEDVEIIKEKRLYIKRENEKRRLFQGKVLLPEDFLKDFFPDIIFLTVKNPVGPVVRYYYQRIKEKGEKIPVLVLSQNGLRAGEEALNVLKEIFGKRAEKIQVIRASLFNPVDKEEVEGKVCINYFLPLYLTFGVLSGSRNTQQFRNLLEGAGIITEEVPPEEVKNMEFSKLFVNLIGTASASRNLSIREGFKIGEIFREEITSLREYIKVVKRKGGRFLNFKNKKMPIKWLADLIHYVPFPFLSLFRDKIGRLIEKGRKGKPKGNLDEVDYYNGEVVRLGKEVGILTPVNERILERVKEREREGF